MRFSVSPVLKRTLDQADPVRQTSLITFHHPRLAPPPPGLIDWQRSCSEPPREMKAVSTRGVIH